MIIVLRNSLHRTEIQVRVTGQPPWVLSASQSRKVNHTLCDRSDCACGGVYGDQVVSVVHEFDGDVPIIRLNDHDDRGFPMPVRCLLDLKRVKDEE